VRWNPKEGTGKPPNWRTEITSGWKQGKAARQSKPSNYTELIAVNVANRRRNATKT